MTGGSVYDTVGIHGHRTSCQHPAPTGLYNLWPDFEDSITLLEVIAETHKLEGSGTMSVHLAVHALRRGYLADLWTCNVTHWDPTWFSQKTDYVAKMKARLLAKGLQENPRYTDAVDALEEFCCRGGKVHWGDLTPRMISGVLKHGLPILTGTNGTYLHQSGSGG